MGRALLDRIKTKYELFEKFIVHSPDSLEVKKLAKELAELFEEFADRIDLGPSGRSILINGTIFSYTALISALVFIILYKNKDEDNITTLSVAKIAEKINLSEGPVRLRIELLSQIEFIAKLGPTIQNVNRYRILKHYEELDRLFEHVIVVDISRLQKEIDNDYFKVLRDITEDISYHILPSSRAKAGGLTPVGEVLIPYNILRTAIVFIALYVLKDENNITNFSTAVLRSLVKIRYSTLRQEIQALIEKGWIQNLTEKEGIISIFKIIKTVPQLDRIPRDKVILNTKDFQRIPVSLEYANALITICEGLTGISFSKVKKEGKKDDQTRDY